MLRKLLTSAAPLALLFAGSLHAQTAQPAPSPATATKDADPALWVLKDEDTTIYLFGTVHVLKPGLSWFDDAVKKAFDDSDQLVIEAPDLEDPSAQAAAQQLGLNKSGTPLSQMLAPKDRATYQGALTSLGIPAPALDGFKPWFASVTLQLVPALKAGYNPNSGAEKTLIAAAKAGHKRISGFETVGQQLGYFDTLPRPLQLRYLVQTAREAPKGSAQLDKMVEQWSAGDVDGLAKTLNEGLSEEPALAKVLLTDRNKRWAGVIADMMKRPGTMFIAVGAGHLAGRGSVQDQLKAYHLKPVRVAY